MARTQQATQATPNTIKERQARYLGSQTAVLAQLEALTVMIQMHGERAAVREYPWELIGDLGYIRTHLNALLVNDAE
jgi:hypothetical protein